MRRYLPVWVRVQQRPYGTTDMILPTMGIPAVYQQQVSQSRTSSLQVAGSNTQGYHHTYIRSGLDLPALQSLLSSRLLRTTSFFPSRSACLSRCMSCMVRYIAWSGRRVKVYRHCVIRAIHLLRSEEVCRGRTVPGNVIAGGYWCYRQYGVCRTVRGQCLTICVQRTSMHGNMGGSVRLRTSRAVNRCIPVRHSCCVRQAHTSTAAGNSMVSWGTPGCGAGSASSHKSHASEHMLARLTVSTPPCMQSTVCGALRYSEFSTSRRDPSAVDGSPHPLDSLQPRYHPRLAANRPFSPGVWMPPGLGCPVFTNTQQTGKGTTTWDPPHTGLVYGGCYMCIPPNLSLTQRLGSSFPDSKLPAQGSTRSGQI
jgi:hypothetical protein